jgi:hypothetical protein
MSQQDPIKLLVYNMLLDIFEEKSKLKYIEYLPSIDKKSTLLGRLTNFMKPYRVVSQEMIYIIMNRNIILKFSSSFDPDLTSVVFVFDFFQNRKTTVFF